MIVPTYNPHQFRASKPSSAFADTAQAAAEVDRHADYLLSVGRSVQAERLANLAAEMRQGVAA
jgi:hypothetical protein